MALLLKWIGIGFFFCFSCTLSFCESYGISKFPAPAFATRLIDNPFRRRHIQNPSVIADRMQLEPGMTVVDIGPGKGSYTRVIAERVLPNGKVYAVDIQEAVIENLNHQPDGMVCLCVRFPDPDYPFWKAQIGWAEQAGFELKHRFGNWFTYQLHFVKKV